MFPEMILNLFIECTERTTRTGFRVVTVSYCSLTDPVLILENCSLLVFGVLMSVLLYQCCTAAISWILPICNRCHRARDGAAQEAEGVLAVVSKNFLFDVTKFFKKK